ncbi:MAG: adenylate/guanylate cyclase domain-containing protein [Planctomycetota bacterium]|jgi:PAS domain S-box-containing protein
MINLKTASREALVQEIENLRRQVSNLQSSSQAGQLRSIVGLDEKVIQLDEKNNIEYVNTSLAKMMGLKREQILGKSISAVDNFKWGQGFLQRLLLKAHEQGEITEEKNYYDEDKKKYYYVDVKCSFTGNKAQFLIEDLTTKKMLEQTFKRYVSPDVMERMLEIQEEKDFFKAERYEMTVLFCDLRGFTSWSESKTPDKVRDTINEYLSAMTEVITHNGATLDKFVGDEVMALFGAPLYYPDHAVRALKVAIEMQEAHQNVMSKWKSKGDESPPMGVGINTGEMIIGNIGSAMRMDYTVLGHHVNLANRLCSLAQPHQILLGEKTFALIQDAAKKGQLDIRRNLKFKKIGRTNAKGISKPVEIILVELRP